jgi:site-specific DNA-methyltransferase (adenine-specific)
MANLRLESVLISSLSLDPTNARRHDSKNLASIEGSLRLFGQRKPIVVTGANVVVAGNGTLEAAKSLGWTNIDVVRIPIDWTPEQVKAYALADNRTAELAEWDAKVLADQLVELDAVGWDVSEFGFEPMNPAGDLDDDEPLSFDEDKTPITKLGDIWQLGNHRLLCGDSTDVKTIDKLMNQSKADLVFTDPPYGMDLDTDYTKMGSGGKKYDAVISDNKLFNAEFILTYFSYCKEIFLWGADYYVETLNRKYPNLGSWIIWDKYSDEQRTGLLDGRFGSAFETCWSKTPHKRELARVLVTTNYTARGDETRVHPTQKPVALAKWFLDRWGKDSKIIVDLFLGSGSTLMACQQLNKSCYGIELDPKYCDVIIDRWERLTGLTATRLEQ